MSDTGIHKSVAGLLIVLAGLLVVTPVLYAERGDTLIVAGDTVNIRTGPSMSAGIIKRLRKNVAVIEISRFEDWVEVTSSNNSPVYGWIHLSLLRSSDGNPLSTTGSEQFELFKTEFIALLSHYEKQYGIRPFTGIDLIEPGALRLTAASEWFRLEQPQRDKILAELFDLWGNFVAAGKSAQIRVVDSEYQQHMLIFK